MEDAPIVTVVMPVYNGGAFLKPAVESILAQTFKKFVFVIYDDFSTDNTFEQLLEWQRIDSRIRVLRGERRLGPVGSSNAAAGAAKTPFVARMDADDVALADRLEVQLAIILSRPNAVLVGSTFAMIDGEGRVTRGPVPARIGGRSPPAHPTILYRRAPFEACGGYRAGSEYFEDLDLIQRLSRFGDLLVVNRPLVSMRFAGQHVRLRDDRYEVENALNRPFAGECLSACRLHPQVFYSLAILKLQARERPGLLWRMIQKMDFKPAKAAAAVLLLVSAGEISPTLTRRLLNSLAHRRDGARNSQFRADFIYRWSFDRPVEDLGLRPELTRVLAASEELAA